MPCTPLPEKGETSIPVSGSLEGLSADTTYRFRVVATNQHGTGTGADQVLTTLPNPPAVTSIAPNAGLEGGGATVTVEGTDLAKATGVHFGTAAASSFTVDSDTSLTAVAPAGAGEVDVTVTNPGGTSGGSGADRFLYVPKGPRPTITGVTPGSGPAAGGTTVTLTGTGFVGVIGVHFGSTAAAGFTTASAGSLSAVSPPATAQTAHVTVTTPNGTSDTALPDRFKFGPPTVTSVSPNSGPASGATTVTVTGTGFALGAGATALKFGTAAATSVECNTITSCTALAPAHKAGSVDVKAT
ncbi:MAG: hypothetical protein QOE67_1464, partial [Solirubrobacteraceae bacterium]|nr:hypothetical protein [Solirubrobacteraceae bacterium]